MPGVAGAFPDTVFAEQLTGRTNQFGERSSVSDQGIGDSLFPYGPYLKGGALPVNPFNKSRTVMTVTQFSDSAPGGVTSINPGWVYEITSGRIKINWAGSTPDGHLYWDL